MDERWLNQVELNAHFNVAMKELKNNIEALQADREKMRKIATGLAIYAVVSTAVLLKIGLNSINE